MASPATNTRNAVYAVLIADASVISDITAARILKRIPITKYPSLPKPCAVIRTTAKQNDTVGAAWRELIVTIVIDVLIKITPQDVDKLEAIEEVVTNVIYANKKMMSGLDEIHFDQDEDVEYDIRDAAEEGFEIARITIPYRYRESLL